MYYKFNVDLKELSDICFPGSIFWKGFCANSVTDFCSNERNISFIERFTHGTYYVLAELVEYAEILDSLRATRKTAGDYIASGQIIDRYSIKYTSHSGRIYHIAELMDDLKDYGGYALLQFHSTAEEDKKGYTPQVAERLIASGNYAL